MIIYQGYNRDVTNLFISLCNHVVVFEYRFLPIAKSRSSHILAWQGPPNHVPSRGEIVDSASGIALSDKVYVWDCFYMNIEEGRRGDLACWQQRRNPESEDREVKCFLVVLTTSLLMECFWARLDLKSHDSIGNWEVNKSALETQAIRSIDLIRK